ncbi:gliding motility-associated peptidyl-prolyl isomerase GldI [Aquimarina sp. W85]|uniref:gliding motility-associated peptidyl-prolyl isomerase GldI n=1 Tax=Aquimarina rhodophyticola TaxID=3342246 RepID=UPI00366D30FE
MRTIFLIFGLTILLVSCKTPEARKPVNTKSGSFLDESITRNKKLSAKEESRILKIIQKDTLNTYKASDGGFWYYYHTKDTVTTIQSPKFGDTVTFSYQLNDLNDNLIYSKKELDTIAYIIDKEELFLGLREGLKLMKPGEVITFLFPSYQAYGYYGDDNKIGTNIPLKAKVTLHTINQESTLKN